MTRLDECKNILLNKYLIHDTILRARVESIYKEYDLLIERQDTQIKILKEMIAYAEFIENLKLPRK